MRIRQLTASTMVGAAALLLTGCGGSPLDGKTGPQVADAAADALEHADAVHIAGDVTESGQKGSVDMHLQGKDADGTITMSGVDLHLRNVGGTVYLQGDSDLWASFGLPEAAAAQLTGKWVIMPAESASQFTAFSLPGIVDQFRHPESDIKKKVGSDKVDGKDVVVVEQKDGGKLFVADDDPAYPLSLTNGGDTSGKLTLSQFGKKNDISKPDGALDLSKLAGGS